MNVVSFTDRVRDQVSVSDQAREVVQVGPKFSDLVLLREPSRNAALGWRFFQDSNHTMSRPLIVPAFVRTQLPVDGRGMLATSYGVNSSRWLHPDTARFYPDREGDFFFYRLNLSVSPAVNNRGILIDFDIGTANHVFNVRNQITSGAGNAVPMSIDCPSGGSAAMMRNGGAFYITPETDIEVSAISVLAFKAFAVIE